MEKANLNYGMPKQKVLNLFEKINDEVYANGLNIAKDKIEKIYRKNLHWNDKSDDETQTEYDESGVDFYEIAEGFADEVSKRKMKIEIGATKSGKKYYVLYFEAFKTKENSNEITDEVEFVESCRCPIIEVDGHDMISWQFIDKIRELAYIGYVMVQSKEYDFLELNGE